MVKIAPGLKAVKTVYDETVYVRQEDLARCKHQLPLYYKSGLSYADHADRMGWRGRATTIAVGNIAQG